MTITQILNTVTSLGGIGISDIRGNGKKQKLVEARAIFSILCKDFGFSPAEIGKVINRDRTTILHYLKNYPEYIKHDEKLKLRFYKAVANIDSNVNNGLQLLEKYNQKLQPNA
jgi:chromosomal replication initiation ATPase DnaA